MIVYVVDIVGAGTGGRGPGVQPVRTFRAGDVSGCDGAYRTRPQVQRSLGAASSWRSDPRQCTRLPSPEPPRLSRSAPLTDGSDFQASKNMCDGRMMFLFFAWSKCVHLKFGLHDVFELYTFFHEWRITLNKHCVCIMFPAFLV